MANHLLRFTILAKFFFYHPWLIRVLMFIGIPTALLVWFSKIYNWELVSHISGFVLPIGLVIIYARLFMMFPVKLMSLISSRQYALLPHLRCYLAVLIFCMLCILLIPPCCWLVSIGANSDDTFHFLFVLAVMLIVSLVAMIPFVQLGVMKLLYVFTLPVLWGYLVPQLLKVPDFILGAILVFVWVAFLSWWFSWRPQKHFKYLVVMNVGDKKEQVANVFWGLSSRGAVPQNLSAGLLFGEFGSGFYQTKLVLTAWILAAAVFALMAMFFEPDARNGLLVCVRVVIAIQLIQLGFNYSFELFKNLNKVWLYFLCDRKQFFSFIEKKVWVLYLKNVFAIASIAAVILLCIPEKYLPFSNLASYMFTALFASLITTPLGLSLVFIVYVKTRGSIKVFHWVNGISTLLLSGAVLLLLELANTNWVEHYLGQLLAIVIVLMGIIVVMRGYAKRLWQKVDLVRVAN